MPFGKSSSRASVGIVQEKLQKQPPGSFTECFIPTMLSGSFYPLLYWFDSHLISLIITSALALWEFSFIRIIFKFMNIYEKSLFRDSKRFLIMGFLTTWIKYGVQKSRIEPMYILFSKIKDPKYKEFESECIFRTFNTNSQAFDKEFFYISLKII